MFTPTVNEVLDIVFFFTAFNQAYAKNGQLQIPFWFPQHSWIPTPLFFFFV